MEVGVEVDVEPGAGVREVKEIVLGAALAVGVSDVGANVSTEAS